MDYIYWIELPKGTRELVFRDLPDLIARARYPVADEDIDFDPRYGWACQELEEELERAVERRALLVRNALTLGEHTFPYGDALQRSVVLLPDLQKYLDSRCIGIRLSEAESPAVETESVPPELEASANPAPRLTLGSGAMRSAFGHLEGVPKKAFSDVPRWMDEPQILVVRRKAPQEHEWNPVAFAKRLMERKGTPYSTLNRLFIDEEALKPFLLEWQRERREANAFGD